MNPNEAELSEKLFRTKYDQLVKQERHLAHHLVAGTPIAGNVLQDLSLSR